MSDRDRDPPPDSLPEVDSDVRSDIEQIVEEETGDEVADDESPLEPTGAKDGVAGTGGVTKNQEENAQ